MSGLGSETDLRCMALKPDPSVQPASWQDN